MSLNSFFLSSASKVNIEIGKPLGEVIDILDSNFDRLNHPFQKDAQNEYKHLSSAYCFYQKFNKLTIFYSKEINRKAFSSFQVNYPRFIGRLETVNQKTQLSGEIGLNKWFFPFSILWLSLIAFLYLHWLTNPESLKGGEYLIYFLAIGLISFLIALIRTRNKVFQLNERLHELLVLS